MTRARSPTRRALSELTAGVVRRAQRDRLTGLAAEVAFFWALALPPSLLAVFASMGYITDQIGPGTTSRVVDRLLDEASAFLSPDGVDTLRDLLSSILGEARGGLFVISVLFALFSASRATRVFMDAVQIAYGYPDTRPLLRRRLAALAITTLGVVAGVVFLPLLALGPRFGAWLADRTGLAAMATAWAAVYVPVVFIGGGLLLASFYHLASSARTPWKRDLPGAALALAAWLGAAFGLRVYTLLAIQRSSVYGAVGGLIVLMLMLYVTALSLLSGAQLNAQIERLWPATPSHPEAAG